MLADPAEGEQRILLGDFGIARRVDDISNLTATNMTVGTVFYAAPEQLMGEDLDGRADQYALAATAFHLLTGSPPFHHSNPTVVISQHLTASPPAIGDRRPELSALDPVLAKALAKDPKDRFDSCADFARALAHRLGSSRRPTSTAPKRRCRSPPGRGQARSPQPPRGNTCARRTSFRRSWRCCCWWRSPWCCSSSARSRSCSTTTTPRRRQRRRATAHPPSRHRHRRRRRRRSPPRHRRLLPPPFGADCSPVGSTATTADGNTVYCSTLQCTGTSIWSPNQGEVPPGTVTTEPTEEPLPVDEESPVLVCMQETGKTRRECREASGTATAAASAAMTTDTAIADRLALADLVHLYASAVDDRRFGDVVELFTETAELRLPDPPRSLDPVRHHHGRDGVRAAMAALAASPAQNMRSSARCMPRATASTTRWAGSPALRITGRSRRANHRPGLASAI